MESPFPQQNDFALRHTHYTPGKGPFETVATATAGYVKWTINLVVKIRLCEIN